MRTRGSRWTFSTCEERRLIFCAGKYFWNAALCLSRAPLACISPTFFSGIDRAIPTLLAGAFVSQNGELQRSLHGKKLKCSHLQPPEHNNTAAVRAYKNSLSLIRTPVLCEIHAGSGLRTGLETTESAYRIYTQYTNGQTRILYCFTQQQLFRRTEVPWSRTTAQAIKTARTTYAQQYGVCIYNTRTHEAPLCAGFLRRCRPTKTKKKLKHKMQRYIAVLCILRIPFPLENPCDIICARVSPE